ncbi:MAG: DUF2867 domain-containing protein [Steroidobacteraceae bacterium]
MILKDNIHILRPVSDLDYYDARSVLLPVAAQPLAAWNLIMSEPQWVLRAAFWLRDAISARFGVKRIGGFTSMRKENVQIGDRLDFFLVEHAAPDVLVLTERDRHLDVMTCLSTSGRTLTVTSSVITHNAFGRAYMLPVGPAHKLIVNNMLRRLKRALETANPQPAGS